MQATESKMLSGYVDLKAVGARMREMSSRDMSSYTIPSVIVTDYSVRMGVTGDSVGLVLTGFQAALALPHRDGPPTRPLLYLLSSYHPVGPSLPYLLTYHLPRLG